MLKTYRLFFIISCIVLSTKMIAQNTLNVAPNLPVILNPIHKDSCQSMNPNLSVFVSDNDGNNLEVIFYGRKKEKNSSTDFLVIGKKTVNSGSNVTISWSGLVKDNLYEWYATVSDGKSLATGNVNEFKVGNPNVQVTFSLEGSNQFCVNTGGINLPVAYPYGGTYSGLSVSGGRFNTETIPGSYMITYTYRTEETGCINEVSDKLNLYNCASLNNTENQNKINIFPNETTNMWILENGMNLHYEVLTMLGIVIQEGRLISTKQVIDMHNAPQGMYFLHLKDENGKMEKAKIISLN